jgi:hypothetical protein
MSDGDEVTIAGRVFRLGAVYAPRAGSYGRGPRRLLQYEPDSPLPGGRVTVELVPSGRRQVTAGTEWAHWAGEEVPASGCCAATGVLHGSNAAAADVSSRYVPGPVTRAAAAPARPSRPAPSGSRPPPRRGLPAA